MVRNLAVNTASGWHVRSCRSCRGIWAAWRDNSQGEPVWFWPTTGTRAPVKVTEAQFDRLKICLCDPTEPRGKKP